MPQTRLSSCPLETAMQTYRDAYLQDMETIWAVLDTSPHGLSVYEAEQVSAHVRDLCGVGDPGC
jgi:hypothetical protein